MPKYRHILFDADNTLFDFEYASKRSFFELLEHFDVKADETIYSIYQSINHKLWSSFESGAIDTDTLKVQRFRAFFDHLGLDKNPVKANKLYLDGLVEHSKLYPLSRPLLERLYRDYSLVIITNGLKEVQRRRILQCKLDVYFKHIVVSDEIGYSKPNPKYFDYTLQLLKNPPLDEILIVGDNLNSDIKGGYLYGIDTCWYNPNFKPNTSAIQPNYQIQSLAQLPELLK